jgi:hypothetical protein
MERLVRRLLRGRISTGLPEASCTEVHRKKKIILFSILSRSALKDLCKVVDVYRALPDRFREDKPLWPDEVARIRNPRV